MSAHFLFSGPLVGSGELWVNLQSCLNHPPPLECPHRTQHLDVLDEEKSLDLDIVMCGTIPKSSHVPIVGNRSESSQRGRPSRYWFRFRYSSTIFWVTSFS